MPVQAPVLQNLCCERVNFEKKIVFVHLFTFLTFPKLWFPNCPKILSSETYLSHTCSIFLGSTKIEFHLFVSPYLWAVPVRIFNYCPNLLFTCTLFLSSSKYFDFQAAQIFVSHGAIFLCRTNVGISKLSKYPANRLSPSKSSLGRLRPHIVDSWSMSRRSAFVINCTQEEHCVIR